MCVYIYIARYFELFFPYLISYIGCSVCRRACMRVKRDETTRRRCEKWTRSEMKKRASDLGCTFVCCAKRLPRGESGDKIELLYKVYIYACTWERRLLISSFCLDGSFERKNEKKRNNISAPGITSVYKTHSLLCIIYNNPRMSREGDRPNALMKSIIYSHSAQDGPAVIKTHPYKSFLLIVCQTMLYLHTRINVLSLSLTFE